ncbi:MAG: RNA polymerase sigma factor [Candidatus Magasanikbacteria bacterium]|jgi:RNA polymerase sigma-70 factor (ECF subfamily)
MTLDQFTDEQLIVEVRENDKEKYAEIIRRYQLKLSHYLRKFIKNSDELEDVLQEVFIRTYRNLYAFDVNKKFSAWIYRIAHNQAINHIKKNNKGSISLDEHEWEIVDEKMDLKKEVDVGLAKIRVGKGIASLKDKYREPLILYFFEQKSYDEISDILRVPTSTVGTLIKRGKEALKEFLENK